MAEVSSGTFSWTTNGLPAWQDHYFAVAPVDAPGNFEQRVTYRGAYSLAPELVSREFALFVGGHPSHEFAETFSREISFGTRTPEPPEQVMDLQVSVSPTGDTAVLDWSGYNEPLQHDLARYDVYQSDRPFTDVMGLTPVMSVLPGTLTTIVTGLEPWRDHYFAVVAVDNSDAFSPSVAYSGSYPLAPEAVSRELALFVGERPWHESTEVFSREVTFLVAEPTVPAPVTGLDSDFEAVTSTSAFSAIDLDWTSYNEQAQRDVVGYRIYVGSSFFTNVSTMLFETAPTGTFRYTKGVADPGSIVYAAVVAEDALGNWDPNVRSVSVKASVGQVGEVRDLTVQSSAESLRFSWRPPQDAEIFLARYLVYFGRSTKPVVLDGHTTSYEVDGLEAGRGYSFRIATGDTFGSESKGTLVIAATLLDNPSVVTAEAFDGAVRLAWPHVEPQGLVQHYAVYQGTSDFASVAGMSPILTTRESQVNIGGLENGTRYYFAVTTVNVSGGQRPEVQSVSAIPAPTPGVFADLAATSFTAPASVAPGQAVTIRWSVTNAGDGSTSLKDESPVSLWVDRIFVSRDDVFGNADDLFLGGLTHGGILASGAAYDGTLDVELPAELAGTYYLVLFVDAQDAVYEHLDQGANLVRAAQTISVTPVASSSFEAISREASVFAFEPQAAPQSITFEAIEDQFIGDPPIALSAAAGSGLPVSFLVLSGPAQIDRTLMTLSGPGKVVLGAYQQGNRAFRPAAPVEHAFRVGGWLRFTLTPGDRTVNRGDVLILQSHAEGTGPLSYQWRRNGNALPGATEPTLIIPDATTSDGGSYTVVAHDGVNTIESEPAVVTLDLPFLPLADDFVDRGLIETISGAGRSSNSGATVEGGEPLHAGKPGGKSVWITWRAPATGIATFSTEGSAFDTLLGVYEGSSLDELRFNLVAADEDDGGFLTSLVEFNALADTEYHIAVDGFDGAEGEVVLNWYLTPTAVMIPIIVEEPPSRTVQAGESVALEVIALGQGLVFQWFFNGQPIAGATGSTLILDDFQAEAVGSYRVEVTNDQDQTVSSTPTRLEMVEAGVQGQALAQPKLQDLFGAARDQQVGLQGGGVALPGIVSVAVGIRGHHLLSNREAVRQLKEPNHCGAIDGDSKTMWFGLRPDTD